ncbi:MAG: signal recognition particle-docking protein FtsY [Treponema sp.]|jgi:fused signal recognition particle receptor|nr:signal recognition particle-docking protein FtsY [Treponema sp.]
MGLLNFTERLKDFFGIKKALSEELFEELTDLLIEGDFGAEGAYKITGKLRSVCKKEKVSDTKGAYRVLARLLEELLIPVRAPDVASATGITVFLLLGVNGVGKTTSVAKLAARYRAMGKRPILAAADTFRAAAIEQLKIHGERLGIRVVAHKHGGDPAAVVYDALEAAQAGAGDLIIADTAGRMHTKSALVEELKKIDRIVENKAKGAHYIKYLVLDATTGRNAMVQAETFRDAVSLDGVILTKLDSSAKGGVVFPLAEELGLPVVFVCNGEKYEDISDFDPHNYTTTFVGLA